MITSNDIAKAAGVSRGTVDRVLHNRGNVSAEKAKKITELAQKMGYIPDAAGMGLAAKKKQFKLGFCYPQASHSPFHLAIAKGAKSYVPHMAQYGIHVTFFPIPAETYEHTDDCAYLKQFAAEHAQMDGFVIAGPLTTPLMNAFQQFGLSDKPIVLCGNDVPSSNRFAFVGCDYFQAGKLACGLAAIATRETGNVGIVSIDDGSLASSSVRIAGFEDEIQACYPGMHIIGKHFLSSRSHYADFEASILQWITKSTDMDILYIVNPGDYSLCKTLFPLAKEKNIQIITNDLLLEEETTWIKEKKLLGVICQEPEVQGQKALEILFNYLVFDKLPDEAGYTAKLSLVIRQNL